jgi:DNA-binding transcriptional LysR family regulator
MALNLDEVRSFCNVAQTGNFSAAAIELGVTTSGLSKSIARLEASLRIQLFNRSTRRVSLTELGEQFLADCVALLAQADRIEEDVRRRSHATAGLLKVNVSSPMGRTVLIPALPALLDKYPELRLDIKFADQPEDLLATGRDIGVWFGKLPDKRLKYRTLARTIRITCATPGYLKKIGVPKSVSDLAQHRCLATSGWAEQLNWRFKSQGEFDRLHLTPYLQVSTPEALRAAVLSGLGVAQASSLLFNVDLLNSGELCQILPEEVVPGDDVSAVFPDARYQNPLIRIFLRFLVDIMNERADLDAKKRSAAKVAGAQSSSAAA